jgi:hypothetical protein
MDDGGDLQVNRSDAQAAPETDNTAPPMTRTKARQSMPTFWRVLMCGDSPDIFEPLGQSTRLRINEVPAQWLFRIAPVSIDFRREGNYCGLRCL